MLLRVGIALSEEMSSVPSTHLRWLTIHVPPIPGDPTSSSNARCVG